MQFEHGGMAFQLVSGTDGFGDNIVRLWVKVPGFNWEIGHSKPVGKRSVGYVQDAMRRFITGEIGHSDYNWLCPDYV